MTARPRGICCVCDRDQAVLQSGLIGPHGARRRRLGVRWPCDGEGLRPRWPVTTAPDTQEDR